MKKYLLAYITLPVLFFAIVVKTNSDLVYLVFWIVWFFVNKIKKIDGRYSVTAGLIFLFICPFVLNSDSQLAQRLASWAFLFLFSGIMLLLIQREN